MDNPPVVELQQEEHSWVYDLWLDAQEEERRALIMRLRQIEKVLIKCGRLSEETLPRRER